jgi:uncharacterized protein YoxC
MSSNDQTPDDATTQPTLQTVLERINAVAEALTLRMNDIANDVAQLRTDVEKRFDTVDDEVAKLRKDVEQGFRRVERKIDLLNRDFLAIRGDQEDMLSRIESLESKAS